jgi:hypothetical protein
MDIRKAIRKIISEIYENEDLGTGQQINRENAKMALIALSQNQIPKNEVKMHGVLDGADFEDSGPTGSSGEVEVDWKSDGIGYLLSCDVYTEFDYTQGSSGRWGSSIDDSEAPEPDDADNLEVHLAGDELKVYDEDGEEYAFGVSELGKEVITGIEILLLNNYDPYEEKISSKR